jgi:hypothetical protein
MALQVAAVVKNEGHLDHAIGGDTGENGGAPSHSSPSLGSG